MLKQNLARRILAALWVISGLSAFGVNLPRFAAGSPVTPGSFAVSLVLVNMWLLCGAAWKKTYGWQIFSLVVIGISLLGFVGSMVILREQITVGENIILFIFFLTPYYGLMIRGSFLCPVLTLS